MSTTTIVVGLLILGILVPLCSLSLVEVFLLVLLNTLLVLWLLVLLNNKTFLVIIPALLLRSNRQRAMTSSSSPLTIVWYIPMIKSLNQVVLVNCLSENGLGHFHRGRVVLDSSQHIEVTKLGHIEHSLKHVLELSAGADAKTLENIKNVLVSKCPCCIKSLVTSKQEKFGMGNILTLNLGEALVTPENKILLDSLLDLTCQFESRSEDVEKVGHSTLRILVKLVELLSDLLVQFGAARIDEKNIKQTTTSHVLTREALVDTVLSKLIP